VGFEVRESPLQPNDESEARAPTMAFVSSETLSGVVPFRQEREKSVETFQAGQVKTTGAKEGLL